MRPAPPRSRAAASRLHSPRGLAAAHLLLLLRGPDVGAVRGGRLGGAGAVLVLAGPHGRKARQLVEDRLLEPDLALGVGAEGVEAAAGGGEVVEPAEEVRRVGTGE